MKNWINKALSQIAYKIERQKLKFDGGWQDQIIASMVESRELRLIKKVFLHQGYKNKKT